MRRIIILITSMFLLGTLAAENFYWMNGSGNWEDPKHWSTDQNEFKPNGEIPGENDNAFILSDEADLIILLNENAKVDNLHWEVGEIESTDDAKLTVLGELYTAETVGNQLIDRTIIKGGSFNSYKNSGGFTPETEKLSAQTPKDKISSDKKPGFETKAAPSITAVNTMDISCNGLADGEIEIIVDAADSYSIDSGATWQAGNIFIVGGGSYRIAAAQGTDTTYLNDSLVVIVEPDPLVEDSTVATPITCRDADDATYTLYFSGETKPYTYISSSGDFQVGNNVFTGLAPGGYGFTVTDANGCASVKATSTFVSNPPDFSIDGVVKSNVNCASSPDASIQITVLGGIAPYEYKIVGADHGTFTHNTSDLSYTFSNIQGDFYNVFVTDANGCEQAWDSNPVFVYEPDTLVIDDVDSTDITGCAGNTNGQILISEDGGVGPYQYSINGDVLSEYKDNGGLFTNIGAGVYDVWVKDANGCKVNFGTVTLSEPDSVKIDASTITQPNCFGENGTVEITATSGGDGGPYQYLVDTAGAAWQAGATFTLPEGAYDIYARDGNLCESEALSVVIDAPDEITFNTTPTNPLCFGDANGSILIDNVAGGSGAGYRYFISTNSGGPWTEDGNGDGLFDGLTDGTYYVYVEDGIGCASAEVQITLTQPAVVDFDVVGNNPSCFGDTDGSIVISNESGGSGSGYRYFIATVSGGPYTEDADGTFENLSGGSYFLYVEDDQGCASAEAQVDLVTPTEITYDVTPTNPLCNGDSNGEILIDNVAGGSGAGYRFFISSTSGGPWTEDGNGDGLFEGLVDGTYYVYVEDGTGCASDETEVTLTQPGPMSFNTTDTNPQCFGDANASIEVIDEAGGNGAPYRYFIGPTSTGPWTEDPNGDGLFDGLTGGTYYVYMEDAVGCSTAPVKITLVEPAEITFNVTPNNPTCNGDTDGTILVDNVSGGSGAGYRYFIGPTAVGPWTEDADGLFETLGDGTYWVYVEDGDGCSSTAVQQDLTEPDPIDFTMNPQNPSCFAQNDGEVALENVTGGNGGYIYYTGPTATGPWTADPNGDGVFEALVDGTYFFYIEDSEGCVSVVKQTTLTEPTEITYDDTPTNPSCFGLSDGTILIDNVAGGSGGGYIYYIGPTATGPWSSDGNGDGLFENLSDGTYYVYVADGSSCDADVTEVILTEPTQVTFDLDPTNPTCNGSSDGTVDVINEAGGSGAGYRYFYSNFPTGPWTEDPNGDGLFEGLADGTYYFYVQDGAGCQSIVKNTTLSEPSEINFTLSIVDPTCFGSTDGSITVETVSGGNGAPYDYYIGPTPAGPWTIDPDGDGVFDGLADGTYYIYIEDAVGCSSDPSLQQTLNEPNKVTFNVASTNPECNGDANGTITISNPAGGNGAPYRYFIGPTDTGAWTEDDNGDGIFDGLADGTYWVYVEDNAGCSSDPAQLVLTEPAAITFDITPTNPTCFGFTDGSILIDNLAGGSGGGYEFYITLIPTDPGTIDPDNNGLFENLGDGTYYVYVLDNNGCKSTVEEVILTEPTEITFDLDPVNPTCNGSTDGTIEVINLAGGSGAGYRYFISTTSGGPWTEDPNGDGLFEGLGDDTYYIYVEDGTPCSSSEVSVTLTEPDPITFDTNPTNPLCNGDLNGEILVDNVAGGSGAGYRYFISTTSGGPWTEDANGDGLFEGLGDGTYFIYVEDGNSCASPETQVDLTEPDVVDFDLAGTDPQCNGETNGTATISNPRGGNGAPYKYFIGPAAIGPWTEDADGLFENLADGTYYFYVEDAEGCASIVKDVTLTEPTQITYNTTPTDPLCFGENNGSILIDNVAGGSGVGYTYWIATSLTGSYTEDADGDGLFDGLIDGTYYVYVLDDNNCSSDTTQIDLVEPAEITFDVTPTDPTCFGNADGEVLLDNVAGGSGAGYTYWIGSTPTGPWTEDLDGDGLFDGLVDGTYYFVVRDGNLCESPVATQVLTQPEKIVVTLIDSLLSCGSLPVVESDTLALPDGTGVTYTSSLEYTEFDPGQVLEAGDIESIYFDIEHSYANDLTVKLIPPGGPSHEIILLQQGINGERFLGEPVDEDDFAPVPGKGYVYRFSDDATTTWTEAYNANYRYDYTDVEGNDYVNKSYIPGGYYIPKEAISNLYGQNLNGTWTLSVYDGAFSDNGFIFKWGINFNEQAYPGQYCNGMLEVAATGGNGGFTYEWSTGDNGAQASGLCADGYTVTVTDALGCSVEYTDSVYDVDIKMIVTDTTHVLCAGDLTGSATVAAEGGNAPYSYAWETGDTGPSASGLAAGWYTITVTDLNSCEYVDSVEIKTIYDLDIVFSDTIPITCSPVNIGDSTGGVTVNVVGGTAPYTFTWSSTDGDTNVATNLTAGWNYVTVSDINCSTIDSIFMTSPDTIRINEIAHQDVLCFGDSTGSTTITVDNGEAPLTIEWSHTADLDLYTLTDLPAGDYTVTVTDGFACMEDTTITILQPADSVTFDIAVVNSSCTVDDGEATANITGGTAPYDVTWYDETLNPIGNGITITGLGVGIYYAAVEDANLCTTELQQFNIENDTDLQIIGFAEVTPVSCNGGCDGEYEVEFTGGVGPYTFLWSDGQTNDTAINLCGDSVYTVTITDDAGCQAIFQDTIPNPTILTVDITDSTNVLCFETNTGTATATANGGTPDYTYIWTDGDGDTIAITADVTGLYADTVYTIEATDARGCQATTTLTLSQPASAVTATVDVTNTDCDVDNGTATINALGGTPFTVGEAYEYLWESGATTATITDLGVGSYPFTVYDSLGCEYLDTAYIISNSDLMIALDDVQGTSCFDACDGSASITVTGGSGDFTYEWPGGIDLEDPVDTLCGGSNTVIVTDNVTGCQISLDVNVPFPAQLIVDEVVTTPALCVGDTTGTAAIVASGGTPAVGSPYTYLWWDGATDSLRNDLAAGPYTVSVYDANMCEATFDFVITEPNPFSYDLDIVPADCGTENGSITVSNIQGGDGNYTVTWQNDDWTVDSTGLSITNLGVGNYTMIIVDGNLCDTIQVINLPDNSDLVVSLVDKIDPTCAESCDGEATIEITGGTEPYTITWSTGATDVLSVNDLCDGPFTVTVTDLNNCSFEFIDSVQAPNSITNTFVYTDGITCAGDSIASLYADGQGGTGELNYIWADTLDNILSNDSSLNNAIAGNRYFVTITDANMCELIDTVDIPEMADSILLEFTTGLTNCPEDSTGWAAVDVTGGVGPYTFNWYKSDDPSFPIVGNDTDSASSLAFGYYVVEVTDNYGCLVIDSVIINSNTDLDFDIEILQEVTCQGNGSAAVVDIENGVGPFEYLWSNGENTETAIALSVGANSVMLTDLSSSCSVLKEFEMSDDEIFNVRVFDIKPDYLPGDDGNGKIALQARGGFKPYTYQWADEDGILASETDSVISNKDQGRYYFTVTDAQGCEEMGDTIIEEAAVDYTADITNVSCYGYSDGSITVEPFGGVAPYTVTWRDVAGLWTIDSVGTTITNLPAGEYIVTINDLFDGIVDTLVVTEPQPYVYNEDITAASCLGADGQIIIEVESGGTEPFTFSWEYNGYPELDTIGLGWAWPSDTTVINDTIENLHVGNYYFTLVDGGGCTTVDTVVLPDNSDFAIDPIPINPDCSAPDLDNGRINLKPENWADPISYNWSHDTTLNDSIAYNLTAGSYAVTVIDNDFCVRADSFKLVNPLPVKFDDIIVENPQCSYDTTGKVTVIPLQGNGSLQYALFATGESPDYQDTANFWNVGTGNYTVRILDSEYCSRDSLIAVVSETPEIDLKEFQDGPGCPTDTSGVIRVEPVFPQLFTSLTYEWMVDSATLTSWGAPEEMYDSVISNDSVIYNVRPGDYIVRVQTQSGCIKEQNITLQSDTLFVLDSLGYSVNLLDQSIYGPGAILQQINACKYDRVSLYASAQAYLAGWTEIEFDTIYWKSGAGLAGYGMDTSKLAFDTATVNMTGTNYYTLRIEAGRCFLEDSVIVNVPDYPDVVASISEDEYTQVFENGRTVLVTNTITDSTYFSWSEYWEVTQEVPPIPTLPSGSDWTDQTSLEVTGLQDSTIYTVIANTPSPYPVADKYCTTTDTVKVRVMGEFNPPSAFSPNGDGINDTWLIYGIDENFSFSLKIYNRWGQLIFESTSANEMLNEGWDGTNRNGNDVTIGTYYYVIEYSDGTKTRKANGPVTVIR